MGEAFCWLSYVLRASGRTCAGCVAVVPLLGTAAVVLGVTAHLAAVRSTGVLPVDSYSSGSSPQPPK